MEERFFNSVRYNTNHVLNQLLPPKRTFTIICDNDLIPLFFPQKTTQYDQKEFSAYDAL